MSTEVALDNDVLLKMVRISLFERFLHAWCEASCENTWGVLGTARYILGDLLARRSEESGDDGASQRLADALSHLEELEPTAPETALAVAMEERAALLGLDFDVGESLLVAIVVLRRIPLLITGDKRAITALERLQADMAEISPIAGRVGCLEQVAIELVELVGSLPIRERLLENPDVDTVLRVCFECSRADVPQTFSPLPALESYVRDLRRDAPSVLVDSLS